MKIAIIGAMKKEIDFLLHNLSDFKETTIGKFVFFEGRFNQHSLVLVEAGIGKVASGILASRLLSAYPDIDLMINIGISGGIKGKTKIADIVVATALKYADADACAIGDYRYGQIPDCPVAFPARFDKIDAIQKEIGLPYQKGVILSGDQFFTDENKVCSLLNDHFPDDDVLCLDMESTALAQSAWFYGVPYIAIRAVSDLIGNHSQAEQYFKNAELACNRSNIFLLEVLKYIK